MIPMDDNSAANSIQLSKDFFEPIRIGYCAARCRSGHSLEKISGGILPKRIYLKCAGYRDVKVLRALEYPIDGLGACAFFR